MEVDGATQIKLNSLCSNQPYIVIIDLMAPTFSEPARFVADTQGLTLPDGTSYTALPLEIKLPSDSAKNSNAQLQIDNIGRVLTDEIEKSNGMTGGTCRIRTLFRDDLNTVIQDYVMNTTSCDLDVTKVTLSLGFEDLLNRPAVRIYYRPETMPGIF